MSRILENLYLGSYADAKNIVFLQKINITHIVTVGVELSTLYPETFKYLYLPAYDSPSYNLGENFDNIADFIHNAIDKEKGKVFVHCYWGISRSTTSVLAYLVKYQKMNPAKARRFVKSKRSIIFPNEGFMQQLEEYAKKLGITEEKNLTKTFSGQLSSRLIGFKGFQSQRGSPESTLREPKVVNHDYHCKNCGLRVFNTNDIEHNFDKKKNIECDAIYIKAMGWMGQKKSAIGKVFCPNFKCNSVLGYVRQSGACSCGKKISPVFGVYCPSVITSKPKDQVMKK